MDHADIAASSKLRTIFLAMGIVMLALWGFSLVPPIQSLGNPNEDGFSYLPLFWATITCLPVGLYLIGGTVAGRGRHVARARTALWLGFALSFLVAAFLIFQAIANSMAGV